MIMNKMQALKNFHTPDESNCKIMLIAGEASGDQHGGKLVQALKQLNPEAECFGIGGREMANAGCKLIFDAEVIAVMGLIEVIKHFRLIKSAWKCALTAMQQQKPQLLILIDYPGFNLRLAKKVKQLGLPIKILYYISPKIWATRPKRLELIKACVDHMVVIFPFELKIYEQAGVPVSYFGCPIVETVTPKEQAQARAELNLSENALIFGLLPGSRKSEIARMLPVLIDVAETIKQLYPHTQFVIPLASTIKESDLWPYIDDSNLPIMLIKRNAHTALSAADVLIGASGTISLEAAILGVPMVIIYKMHAFTYWLAKKIIKIKYIGLPNILANRAIMPELIQKEARSENIVQAAVRFINDDNYLSDTQQALAKIRTSLGAAGTAEKVAQLALQMIKEPN